MTVYDVVINFEDRNRFQRFKFRVFAELCYLHSIKKYNQPVALAKIRNKKWMVTVNTIKEWRDSNDN